MIFLIIFISIVVIMLISAYICYSLAFKTVRNKTLNLNSTTSGDQYKACKNDTDALIQRAAAIEHSSEHFIDSFDGLKLHGSYYEIDPDAPCQILFHGYKGSGLRDLSGGLILALENGFNVLLIDQRGHGISEGRCLTMGIKERYDVSSWAHYVSKNLCKNKIVLVGISMGAASVLMASTCSLPENVSCIIADSAYSSPEAIIRKVIEQDMKLPHRLVYPLVRLGALIYGHFDPSSCSPENELKSCTLPVLFIHGENDRFVPYSQGLQNYFCCNSSKEWFSVKDAGHGLAFIVNREEYIKKEYSFLSKYEII